MTTNELLRSVDWRFLLHRQETPRCLDLTAGRLSTALELVTEPAGEDADLVVLGTAGKRDIEAARAALREGGELACALPRSSPGGLHRLGSRLEQFGFVDVRFYRPGLDPGHPPELWLPLEAPAALEAMLEERPPHSRREALLRQARRRFGPLVALARLPGDESADGSPALPDPGPWALLTGGPESDAKVVALPFSGSAERPATVVKFARTDKAEAALAREAEILEEVERTRSLLRGVPRLRGRGRRGGRLGIVQDAFHGRSMNATLDADAFAVQAPRVTRWLLDLAGEAPAQRPAVWHERLVAGPLDELEAEYADRLPAGLPQRAHAALADFGALPLVCEHRDFGPWNVILGADGEPAAIDWEDAEPQGLPGLDLVYFLAAAGFELGDPPAAVVDDCLTEYRTGLGIADADFQRLRLLCWIVQSLIALRRLSEAGTDDVPAASDARRFVQLAEVELRALESQN